MAIKAMHGMTHIFVNHMASLDARKVYDRVNHVKLLRSTREIGECCYRLIWKTFSAVRRNECFLRVSCCLKLLNVVSAKLGYYLLFSLIRTIWLLC